MPKTVMTPVYMPEDWHAAFKKLADAEGITFAEWARNTMYQAAPKTVRKSLSEPAKRGNPTFGKGKGE